MFDLYYMSGKPLFNEEELRLQLTRGDEQAFARIVHYYYPRLLTFVLKVIQDKPAAAEVVQQVFLRCWKRRAGFEQIGQLGPWLFEAASEQALNLLQPGDAIALSGDLQDTFPLTAYDREEVDAMIKSIVHQPGFSTKTEFGKLSLAVFIIIITGLCSYFIFFTGKKGTDITTSVPITPPDIIPPKTNRAIITLSNGKKIHLDTAAKGTLGIEGGGFIYKESEGRLFCGNIKKSQPDEIIYTTLTNPKGSRVLVMTLSDGSHVWLNAGSTLTFPLAFIGNERKVYLTGEAYFEVEHNHKPFKVQLPPSANAQSGTEITVLGTHFNVNAYDDESDSRITLMEGAVQIKCNEETQKLKPGQQAALGSSISLVNGIDTRQVIAWKNNEFLFGDKADIQTVMRQLSRWYDIDIEYKIDLVDHIGGAISRDVNLSQVLQMLGQTGSVRFKTEGKKVIVMPGY
jgi:transmembrane sensor